ncbi:N-acyl-phosphatidylethanolamine-hydrolyzing phospholipase D-like [Anneissia japonica]|uniref:N-acyl-phosphatidylethanolamine-hydrolyzing phospholipase D-like n=1 Tax=Anneissia japonica TaxID=1529436 RepID=UPI0014258760|nr:N-acyl-phosphatidylethanolamine-hydrolyzing phospholipase D-like [Anneissia japonica]
MAGIYERIPADEQPEEKPEQDDSAWIEDNDPGYETLPGCRPPSEIQPITDGEDDPSEKEDPYMFIAPRVPEPLTNNNNFVEHRPKSKLSTVCTGRRRVMGESGIKLGPLDFRKLESVTASQRTKWGNFINPWDTWKMPSATGVLKWKLCSKNNRAIPSKSVLDKTLPIVSPNIEEWKTPPSSGIRVSWLGHACVLVQFDGITILTDPIFSMRCSPSQHVGPKRYRGPPCDMYDLPSIDAVLISHAHYDHLDLPTVKFLNARFGSSLRWFVPLGLMNWMMKAGCENVIEMDWWQENGHPDHMKITFAFTPTQHWSNRALHDNGWYLWGSWCVFGPNHSFFFGGDTGYCEAFSQIGRRYGPFDLAAIPIGAYEPRWFKKPQHINPQEAVQVHTDLQSSASIGIHWGTFPFGNEFYLDPPKLVKEEMEKQGLNPDDFFTLNHGESRLLYEETLDYEDASTMCETGSEGDIPPDEAMFEESGDDKSMII